MKKYWPDWLNRYLLVSLAVHLLILWFVARLPRVQEVVETPLTFEIVNPVVPEPKKPAKPKALVKPTPKPIRRYREQKPIEPTAKLSINKDGHIRKKTGSKAKEVQIKQRKPEAVADIISPPPTAAGKPKSYTAPPPSRQRDAPPFESGDILVKRREKTGDEPAAETENPSLEEILANLEKYIDFDKYSREAYYFGGSKLSFEDQDFHYVWYGRIIKRRVADGWYPPYVARMGLTGLTVVTFKIQRDGRVSDIKLSESSGNKSLDQAALNAVQSVGHLPELPVDYLRPSLGVVFSFYYNLRIPYGNGAG
jgi:protein TonB